MIASLLAGNGGLCWDAMTEGLGSMVLAAQNPLEHVVDGRLFFDSSGALFRWGITKQAFMFFVAGALTLIFFWSYAKKAGRHPVPSRWGSFVELVIEFLRDKLVRTFMGTHGDRYVPLIATFFVYILFCNLLGLVPLFDFLGQGGNTATGNLYITGAFALCAFVSYHSVGVWEQGLFTYVKNLFPPVPFFVLPIIVVVELLAHVVRPCALAIRLFANMLAGHTLVAAILGFTVVFTKDYLIPGGAISLASVAGVTVLMFLELLVALIQAFVFTFLMTVYLAGAVHPGH